MSLNDYKPDYKANADRRALSYLSELKRYQCPYCKTKGYETEIRQCIKQCRSEKAKKLWHDRLERRFSRTTTYLLENVDDLGSLKDTLIEATRKIYRLNLSFEEWELRCSNKTWTAIIAVEGVFRTLEDKSLDGWKISPFFLGVGTVRFGFQGFTDSPTIWSRGEISGNLKLDLRQWPLMAKKIEAYESFENAFSEDLALIGRLADEHRSGMNIFLDSDPELSALRNEQAELERRLITVKAEKAKLESELRAAYPKMSFPDEPILPKREDLISSILG